MFSEFIYEIGLGSSYRYQEIQFEFLEYNKIKHDMYEKVHCNTICEK